MAKALKTAALIVGAVAVVVGTAGALAPAATAGFLGSLGVTASAAAVASAAGAISGVLSLAAGLTARKPTAQATGSQTVFSADPDANIPWVIGRIGRLGVVQRRCAA